MDAKGVVMDAAAATDQGYSGVAAWLRSAERAWKEHTRGDLTLLGRWNYHNELGAQFPPRALRVVYAKAGTQPAACLLRDATAIVDHMLYWAEPESEDEGYFLLALLNSEEARSRIAKLQARGQFGARHFDKVMFTLPIPRFAARTALHRDLAAAARDAEAKAAALTVDPAAPFARARRQVRDALRADGVSDRIDALVAQLLDGAT